MNLPASPLNNANLIPWRAQLGPQLTAIRKPWVEELLYGGAVFGGKSDFLLGDFAQDIPTEYGAHWHGILFRRTYPQLEELISRSKEIYPAWFGLDFAKAWSASTKTWTWPNGATLKLRFMQSDDDWQEYWGHAYTWIGWDELALWASSVPYMRMKARLRSAHPIPYKRIRASANPGGPGHHWVKKYFGVDRFPLGSESIEPGDGSGMRRMFIRSRLTDNQIGLKNDPAYSARLEGLGSPELIRALKEGDWNIIAGAFFPEFDIAKHVIVPFTIPNHWVRYRSMDWGSAAPFAVHWWAVSDGEVEHIPRGALVCYREWYGATPDDQGLKLTAEEVGDGIVQRDLGEKIDFGDLDPSAFARNGGPSIAERLADRGAYFNRADNTRVGSRGALGGWDLVRQRLKGEDAPLIYFFANCPDTIRTLPAVQHDPHRIEDVDSSGNDHCADSVRYACAARPWVRDKPGTKPVKFEIDMPFNELVRRARQMRLDSE
jgi:hypothetical protein